MPWRKHCAIEQVPEWKKTDGNVDTADLDSDPHSSGAEGTDDKRDECTAARTAHRFDRTNTSVQEFVQWSKELTMQMLKMELPFWSVGPWKCDVVLWPNWRVGVAIDRPPVITEKMMTEESLVVDSLTLRSVRRPQNKELAAAWRVQLAHLVPNSCLLRPWAAEKRTKSSS